MSLKINKKKKVLLTDFFYKTSKITLKVKNKLLKTTYIFIQCSIYKDYILLNFRGTLFSIDSNSINKKTSDENSYISLLNIRIEYYEIK